VRDIPASLNKGGVPLRCLSIALGGWGLVMLLCYPAMARTSHDIHGGNCVAYAREVTGVHLDGNAAAWWPQAEGRYERGHTPQVGAILVFKPYGGMHVGHVAVVSRVVSAREVLVDQANWVRGRVTKAMSVIDASPANDWTSVEVQYGGTHGRDNPTYGFIYPHVLPDSLGEAVTAAEPDQPHVTHAGRIAARVGRLKDVDEQETAAKPDRAPHHVAARTNHHRYAEVHEAAAKPDPAPLAERAKHHTDVEAQEAAAQARPAPRRGAAHTAHHETRPARDQAKAAPSTPLAQQLAAATPPHHTHKTAGTRLTYVLY